MKRCVDCFSCELNKILASIVPGCVLCPLTEDTDTAVFQLVTLDCGMYPNTYD